MRRATIPGVVHHRAPCKTRALFFSLSFILQSVVVALFFLLCYPIFRFSVIEGKKKRAGWEGRLRGCVGLADYKAIRGGRFDCYRGDWVTGACFPADWFLIYLAGGPFITEIFRDCSANCFHTDREVAIKLRACTAKTRYSRANGTKSGI